MIKETAQIPLEPLVAYTSAVARLMGALVENDENWSALDVAAHVALLDIRDAATDLSEALDQIK